MNSLVVMNPKAENLCAERRAPSKIEQADCPEKIWKKILEDKQYYRRWVSIWHRFPQRAKNFTDVGRRFEFERGKIKCMKAVNVFGLVTKSWQSKLTIKRYEKHSKRQGTRANHPKQTTLPERRAPSAHFFRASITTRSFPIRPCIFFIKDQPVISHNIKLEPNVSCFFILLVGICCLFKEIGS